MSQLHNAFTLFLSLLVEAIPFLLLGVLLSSSLLFLIDEKHGLGQKCGEYARLNDYPSDGETILSIAETPFPFPFIDMASGKVEVRGNALHVKSVDTDEIHWPKILPYEGATIHFDLLDHERLDELLDKSLSSSLATQLAHRPEPERTFIEAIISMDRIMTEPHLNSREMWKAVQERLGQRILWKQWTRLRQLAKEDAKSIGIEILANGRPRRSPKRPEN